MFSSQDVTVNYILHKGKIHYIGPISGESRNFNQANRHWILQLLRRSDIPNDKLHLAPASRVH